VVADQGAGPIFAMMSSFHTAEPGLAHAITMPDAPPPEAVATVPELLARPDVTIPETMRTFYAREAPMDLRYVDIGRFLGAPATTTPATAPAQPSTPALALEGRQRIWLRARTRLPDAPALHQALLAYASDFALVETALLPHGRLIFGGDLQLASLDHGLWFHRPFRVDDWLLYVVDSPVAVGGRGFSRGAFFTADGTIVASVTQELLMRHQSAQREIKN
jgi:acyl-CoA thioesterase-2